MTKENIGLKVALFVTASMRREGGREGREKKLSQSEAKLF